MFPQYSPLQPPPVIYGTIPLPPTCSYPLSLDSLLESKSGIRWSVSLHPSTASPNMLLPAGQPWYDRPATTPPARSVTIWSNPTGDRPIVVFGNPYVTVGDVLCYVYRAIRDEARRRHLAPCNPYHTHSAVVHPPPSEQQIDQWVYDLLGGRFTWGGLSSAYQPEQWVLNLRWHPSLEPRYKPSCLLNWLFFGRLLSCRLHLLLPTSYKGSELYHWSTIFMSKRHKTHIVIHELTPIYSRAFDSLTARVGSWNQQSHLSLFRCSQAIRYLFLLQWRKTLELIVWRRQRTLPVNMIPVLSRIFPRLTIMPKHLASLLPLDRVIVRWSNFFFSLFRSKKRGYCSGRVACHLLL